MKVLRKGTPVAADKRRLARLMAAKVVEFSVDLHLGRGEFSCYGCDLTHEYVRINAEYHT